MPYADEALRALLRRLCVRREYAPVGIFGSWQLCPKHGAAARERKSGKYAIIRAGRLSRAGALYAARGRGSGGFVSGDKIKNQPDTPWRIGLNG